MKSISEIRVELVRFMRSSGVKSGVFFYLDCEWFFKEALSKEERAMAEYACKAVEGRLLHIIRWY